MNAALRRSRLRFRVTDAGSRRALSDRAVPSQVRGAGGEGEVFFC